MPKRFTDTEKWKKKWVRQLDPEYKLFWVYLLDVCNHAGIWDVDIELVNFILKTELSESDLIEVLGDKIEILDNGKKWFIPAFIDFQYNADLNPNNQVHKSVISLLQREGAYKGLTRGLQASKAKDKDKVKDKETIYADEVIENFNKVTSSNCRFIDSNRKQIIARINEGFTIADCITVIEKKYNEWKNDKEMSKYITIETLFRPSKFDKYLNQKNGANDAIDSKIFRDQ